MKKYQNFLSENFPSLVVKFSIYLNRRVFVMFFFYLFCFHYENMLFIMKTCLFNYTENFTIKNELFQIKNSDIFHISAQNIDCGYSLEPPRRDGSNDYPQSMFLSRNKKNNIYPINPSFTI